MYFLLLTCGSVALNMSAWRCPGDARDQHAQPEPGSHADLEILFILNSFYFESFRSKISQ
jgi:hypothetical protein